MMHDQTVTLYNYHEPTGCWYTTVLDNVTLTAARSSSATQHGAANGDTLSISIPATADKTAGSRRYIGPKAYSARDAPGEFFTFWPEHDFVVVGRCPLERPVSEDDYDNGLYHEMNREQDEVYMITSAAFYGLIPHFEVEGR
nr:MAG TPA: hypothetical protein [Caudoviricetes sp.]